MGGDIGIWVEQMMNAYKQLESIDSKNQTLKYIAHQKEDYLWNEEFDDELEIICPPVNRGRSEAVHKVYRWAHHESLLRSQISAYDKIFEEIKNAYSKLQEVNPSNKLLDYVSINCDKIIINDVVKFESDFKFKKKFVLSKSLDEELRSNFSFLSEGFEEKTCFNSENTYTEMLCLTRLIHTVKNNLLNKLYITSIKKLRKNFSIKLFNELKKIEASSDIIKSIKVTKDFLEVPKENKEVSYPLGHFGKKNNYSSKGASSNIINSFKDEFPAIANYIKFDSIGERLAIPFTLINKLYLVHKENKKNDLNAIDDLIKKNEKEFKHFAFIEWGESRGIIIKEEKVGGFLNNKTKILDEKFFNSNPKISVSSNSFGLLFNYANYANELKKRIT